MKKNVENFLKIETNRQNVLLSWQFIVIGHNSSAVFILVVFVSCVVVVSSIISFRMSVVIVLINYPFVFVVIFLPRPTPSPTPSAILVITITDTIIHTVITKRIKMLWALNTARGWRQYIGGWFGLSIDVLDRRLKSVCFYKWVRQSARKLDQQPKITYEYWWKR